MNSDDEELEITEKGNFSADNILVINCVKNDRQPGIPRPWELRGKDADEYWQRVYQDVVSGEMKKRADDGRLAPWEEELLQWTENDTQFWNYKDDFKDMKLDEIPRFKTPLLRPQLFVWKEGNEWLPIGRLKFACAETLLSHQYHVESTLVFGEPSIELFSQNMTYFTSDFEWKTSPPGSITDITYDRYIYRESSNVESDTPPTSGSFEIFECAMAIYGREDNYRGHPRSRSTDSYKEKRRYSHNYSPVRYRRPPPHLVMEFIENIRVISLTMTILRTTDIQNVMIISLSIVQCPQELARTKIVYETVEIPPAIRPARNYQKRKLFAKRRRQPHLLLWTFRHLSLRCPTIISSPSNKLV